MATASCFQVKEQIELTETEKKIFDRLLNTLRHFNLQTQLRVAGGWVRDKNAVSLDPYCCPLTHKLHVSYVGNPEKSKHIETARMCLFDLWIDFANLRNDNYSENSSIPMTKFGTAEEDAYRRDLTIIGARFGFSLDEELKKTVASDDVETAFPAKVSEERIGTEIDLMISGNQPVKVIDHICDLTLFRVVFNLPPRFQPAVSEEHYRFVVN
ncbi:hypothetical protein REPUB_Repub02eG0009800 [Reevesia pubescens]